MDLLYSWTLFLVTICSFLHQSHQTPIWLRVNKFADYGKQKAQSNGISLFKTGTDSHIAFDKKELLEFRHPHSSSYDLKRITTSDSNHGTDNIQGKAEDNNKDNTQKIRRRRNSEYYSYRFSRCCYLDVMCSRGCRRRGKRSISRIPMKRKIACSEEIHEKIHQTGVGSNYLKASKMFIDNTIMNLAETKTPDFEKKAYSKIHKFEEELGKDYPFRNAKARHSYLNHAASENDSRHDVKSKIKDKKLEIVEKLPQILDSLEYLMKNNRFHDSTGDIY